MSTTGEFDHFVDAQRPLYSQVLRELAAGNKQSHWMWFIFPQRRGLAPSAMSQRYALDSAAAAARYLQHPVLGPRLRECTQLVLDVEGQSAEDIFGMPDCLKFHSSMTLFALSSPADEMFKTALDKYFHGRPDANTVRLLEEN